MITDLLKQLDTPAGSDQKKESLVKMLRDIIMDKSTFAEKCSTLEHLRVAYPDSPEVQGTYKTFINIARSLDVQTIQKSLDARAASEVAKAAHFLNAGATFRADTPGNLAICEASLLNLKKRLPLLTESERVWLEDNRLLIEIKHYPN